MANQDTFYLYRRGNDFGLYAIPLDDSDPNYLKMSRIVDGKSLLLNIYDMAFHPFDGFAYAVDRVGALHRINVSAGTSTSLGLVGETGVFGAVYFDVSANLYISRNNDGKIFRIAIDSGNYSAAFYASGPASSTNDGARCALAPVIPIEGRTNVNLDFGDAPESYGTSADNIGAVHGLPKTGEPVYFLGNKVDGEGDASPFPLSDDETDGIDDEDGVQFTTGLVSGRKAVVLVTASVAGFLNAWLDTNQNGTFDDNERLIDNVQVVAGKHPIHFDIPNGSTAGSSWMRFRFASTSGAEATGGMSDGEIEDYSVEIIAKDTTTVYYPSISGWTTVAYEDNWPFEGDLDMNDLVLYLRTEVSKDKSKKVSSVRVQGEIAAVGAAFHNGFAIRLPNIARADVDELNIRFKINDRDSKLSSTLESGTDDAILIIVNDVWDYVSSGNTCSFYRTEPGCGSSIQMTFDIIVPMKTAKKADISGVFDPFLFATPGAGRDSFPTPPGRSYEIHLKNHAPTNKFNLSLFDGSGVDASNPAKDLYFLTNKGMPWAMEIGARWNYPKERKNILQGYPQFLKFVTSKGESEKSWYLKKNAISKNLFTN